MRRLTSRGVERVASRKLRVLIFRIGSDSGPSVSVVNDSSGEEIIGSSGRDRAEQASAYRERTRARPADWTGTRPRRQQNALLSRKLQKMQPVVGFCAV